jgi:hypothetical protein
MVNMMKSFAEFCSLLKKMDVVPGIEVPLDKYQEVILQVKEQFGDSVRAFLMDCFSPMGGPIDPDYDERHSNYQFTDETWEELHLQWNQAFED